MTITREELMKRFPKASEAFLRQNADQHVSHSAIGGTGALDQLVSRIESLETVESTPARRIRSVKEEKVETLTFVPPGDGKPFVRVKIEGDFAISTNSEPASLLYFTRFVPVEVLSEANSHTHWRSRQKRAKEQREAVNVWLRNLKAKEKPTLIFLERVGSRELDDDNLAGSFKHVRDEIAALLRFDDRDKGVKWAYGQQLSRGKRKGFNVSISWRGAPMCPHCGKQP